MSVQVEKLEHNMAKLTIEVEASKFDAAMKKAYNKKKGSFNLPGFRKGKVPMYIIEKEYGAATEPRQVITCVFVESSFSTASNASSLCPPFSIRQYPLSA